jgi:hypothetical protein
MSNKKSWVIAMFLAIAGGSVFAISAGDLVSSLQNAKRETDTAYTYAKNDVEKHMSRIQSAVDRGEQAVLDAENYVNSGQTLNSTQKQLLQAVLSNLLSIVRVLNGAGYEVTFAWGDYPPSF